VDSVETVLKMCGLEKYADAIVGTLGVEHRKRTTIGVELAAKVYKVMFCPRLSHGDTPQAQIASIFGRANVRP
jgi:ATP-binding cassette subfamily G (WHITE) protein 2 (SNQ2)